MVEVSGQDSFHISRSIVPIDVHGLKINMTQPSPSYWLLLLSLHWFLPLTLSTLWASRCWHDLLQVLKPEIPEHIFLFYFIYYIRLLTKSCNFEMTLQFVPWVEEKLVENPHFTRGSFSSSKEITQASSWLLKTKVAWRFCRCRMLSE